MKKIVLNSGIDNKSNDMLIGESGVGFVSIDNNQSDIGEKIYKECINNDVNVIIVNSTEKEPDDTFILNGVKYTPIVKENKKHSSYSNKISNIMGVASMLYMPYMMMNEMFSMPNTYQRKLAEGTDIIKEYVLIQEKESKLSKWEREQVVFIFEKNFKRI